MGLGGLRLLDWGAGRGGGALSRGRRCRGLAIRSGALVALDLQILYVRTLEDDEVEDLLRRANLGLGIFSEREKEGRGRVEPARAEEDDGARTKSATRDEKTKGKQPPEGGGRGFRERARPPRRDGVGHHPRAEGGAPKRGAGGAARR